MTLFSLKDKKNKINIFSIKNIYFINLILIDKLMTSYQKEILKKYQKYKWDKPIVENLCVDGDIKEPKKQVKLNQTQEFVSKYFTPEHENGILLFHSVGSGKTLSAIAIMHQFEKLGYNTLWVTRTTLKKDLYKGLEMLPLKNHLMTVSYKQFSNIGKFKGELYKKLMNKAHKLNPKTNDPLYKTIVVIDEVHKLYTKDLKPQEMHDISKIENMIYKSYSNSGNEHCKIVLMSATPITENPLELIHLFNLIIENPKDRFDVNSFTNKYLDGSGKFTKETKNKFSEKIKNLVSYIDMSKDPRKFAQIKYQEVLVPLSVPDPKEFDFEARKLDCQSSYEFLSQFMGKEYAKQFRKECLEEIKEDKKNMKGMKYQSDILKKKCQFDVNQLLI